MSAMMSLHEQAVGGAGAHSYTAAGRWAAC